MTDVDVKDIQLADDHSQRTPCVLVLDASASMEGRPIEELNAGLALFANEVKADDHARGRVQISIVRVGGDERQIVDWTDVRELEAPTLEAGGATPLGRGMDLALRLVEEQKSRYTTHGIKYTRPWIWLISDGLPTDEDWELVADRCRQAERGNHVVIYAVGVDGANMDALKKFTNQDAMRLRELDFRGLFKFLSDSVRVASRDKPGTTEQIAAPPTITIHR